jgi:hypothetical protein
MHIFQVLTHLEGLNVQVSILDCIILVAVAILIQH